jgi:hypothetical protein
MSETESTLTQVQQKRSNQLGLFRVYFGETADVHPEIKACLLPVHLILSVAKDAGITITIWKGKQSLILWFPFFETQEEVQVKSNASI